MASESVDEGYLVVFDPKIPVGEARDPRYHEENRKRIVSFTIAVGKS